jgi:hypothetical protein
MDTLRDFVAMKPHNDFRAITKKFQEFRQHQVTTPFFHFPDRRITAKFFSDDQLS